MDLPFSEKCLLLFLVAMNTLFIISGGMMMSMGIDRTKNKDTVFMKMMDSFTLSGGSSITVGALEILVGGFGLFGIWFKKKIVLFVYLGVLAAMIIGSLVFAIGTLVVTSADAIEGAKNITENVRNYYGDVETKGTLEITLNTDKYQHDEQCCGWSMDPGDNIFTSTPWKTKTPIYNGTVRVHTLPPSCCKSSTGPACVEATDLNAARKSGHVYEKDCLDVYMFSVKFPLYVAVGSSFCMILLQIASVGATWLYMSHIPDEVPSE